MVVDGKNVVVVVGQKFLAVLFGIMVDEDCSSVIDEGFVVVEVQILPAIFGPIAVDILQVDISIRTIRSLLGIGIGGLLDSA